MYMNVIRNVICTLIILPIGLQAETSHSSMAKDTITVVATALLQIVGGDKLIIPFC